MSMFPGAGATVYYNDAGEPLGWDYPPGDPPEPDDLAPEPYRSDEVLDLWTRLTDAQIAAETAEHDSLTLTGLHPKTLRKVAGGAEDIVLHSADGSVYIGTVQDYDELRATVTVELR